MAESQEGRLFPATKTYTYRQKVQRAFATEFLCPLKAASGIMDGDFSSESQEEVANYFNVSPLLVETLLVNNGLIDRDQFIDEIEVEETAA